MAVIDRKGYSVLPWGDMWDYWILRSKANFLTTLAAQHNEHRIAVARLFFVVDQTFFQARSVFIFVSIFLIQLFHAVLLSCLACRARTNQRTTAVFLGSAAFVCLFSAQQYTNFTWGFQIQFVAVYFAVAGALAALMSLASLSAGTPMRPFQRRSFWLVMAIVTGVIATYSMANGLLVWPILLLAAFCLGVPWREKLVLLVAGVVVWTLYLWGYKTPVQHSSIGDGFHNLPQSFAFAMCVLGSPLDALVSAINKIFSIGGENWRLVWTAAGGLAGLITGAFLWGNFVRNRHEASRSEVVVLHILLFVIATVFLIGFGRTNFPLVEALQSRYTTPALLFWFCILFLFSLLIERNFTRRGDRSLLLLFQFASTAILVLVIVLHQPPQIRYARNAAVYLSEVEAAISAPVYDQEIWGRIYHNPKAMIPAVRYLQSNHLSVFALERVKWLGDPITAHYKMVDSGRCAGYFDEAEALAPSELPGFRLQGWAWDGQLKRTAKSIVFTDGRGQIMGFGYTGFERPDVRAEHPNIGYAGVGWKGYIPGVDHNLIEAHMVTDAGLSSCLIGTHDVTPFREPPEQLRPARAPTASAQESGVVGDSTSPSQLGQETNPALAASCCIPAPTSYLQWGRTWAHRF